jgi:uncharacterized protein (DUF1800 family)
MRNFRGRAGFLPHGEAAMPVSQTVALKTRFWNAVEIFFLLITGLLIAALLVSAQAEADPTAFTRPLDPARQMEHVINRLTFGATASTVSAVRAIGVEKWVELQLNPQKIVESKTLEEKLAGYPALWMSTEDLAREYPNRQYLRAVSRGRVELPSDPEERRKVEALAKAYAERERTFLQQAGTANTAGMNSAGAKQDEASPTLQGMGQAERLIALAGMTPEERQAAIRTLPAAERRALMENVRPAFTVQSSLVAGKLMRAVYSERQLEELMTDFWFNHFNVSVQKEADRYYTIPYERDVIRKHAFGKFENLLVATAQSPAMLFYLDNFQSISPDARLPRRRQAQGRQPQGNRVPRGLNENYARELMELHTLGVNGGYTQQDVTEVARCFTGWTIDIRTVGGGFRFVPMLHDNKPKTVLGRKIDVGGMKDGLTVLSLLAQHPSTARFISTKLAQRFVADQPPASLVDAMSATFTRTGGDIREVLRTMFRSKEFLSEGAYRAKVKQPFEMLVSAIRALKADVAQPLALARSLDRLGQPIYRKQEPTGYSSLNAEWVNSAALVERMNLALGLAANRVPGVRWSGIPESAEALVERARAEWLMPANPSTVDAIRKAVSDPAQEQLRQYRGSTEAQLWAGLLLGSPEFQRR